MKSNIAIQDWRFSWIENAVVVRNKISIKTPEDIKGGDIQRFKRVFLEISSLIL